MANEAYTVVVLDDEEIVTTSISTLFMLETEYEVLAYNSPAVALEETDGVDVDLIISDYLMPGELNGVDFLLEMKSRQPDAIRILLTAYADKENAIRAINDVGLYQYVEKPWDNEALLLITQNGLRHRSMWKELREKTEELNLAVGNLERVQAEVLRAFI